MVLGFSFGSNKSKSESKIDKTETTNQNKTETSNSTQQSTSNTNQSSSSTGSTNSTQTGTQVSDATKNTIQTGRTSLFGDGILASLEGRVQQMLASTNPAQIQASTFNGDQFVNEIMRGATARSQDQLDQIQGGLGDMIGANPLNSSMGSLLMSRAQSDAAASLASAQAQAQATAEGIMNQNNQTQLAAGGQGIDMLNGLLNLLRGGQQTTTQQGTEGTTGTTTNTATGSTNTSEQSNQQSQTQAMQTIQQLVEALLAGTTRTVGTENVKSSGSNIGLSASFGGKG